VENDKQTKKEVTMDDLARIVQDGFLTMEERMADVETNVKEIKNDIGEVKSDTEYIKAEINKKADKFSHNELSYRVEKLEKKFA
jgi:hypothetical protein